METTRIESFSDGVFAIAITLLVLDIAVPPPGTDLGVGLLQLWPSYAAYAVSFLLIGSIWANHHAMFQHIVRADGTLLVLNLFQLLIFAFLPFPTSVLAEAFHRGADQGVAAAFYGGTLAVGGVFVTAVWQYASWGHRLLSDLISADEARRIGRRYLAGPLVYALAVGVGLVLPSLSLLLYAGISAFYLWPRQVDDVVGTSAEPARPETS